MSIREVIKCLEPEKVKEPILCQRCKKLGIETIKLEPKHSKPWATRCLNCGLRTALYKTKKEAYLAWLK